MSQIIVFDDLVAPVLSNPTDTATGSETANLGVDTTKDNGTVYWVVTQSAVAPSAAQIIAGTDEADAAADDDGTIAVSTLGTQSAAATGLDGSTTYYGYFVQVDVSGNTSNVASGDGFTTDSAGDTTAPVLTSPTDTGTAQTTGSLGVTTDEDNGTIYWVVTTASNTPSKAQVKAGQDHTGAAATFAGSTAVFSTGTKAKTATGLTANTQYFVHVMHEDAAANQSDVVSGDGFYTAPSNQTLSTPGSGNFTMPTAAPYYKLTVTVKGAGGGGQGGDGGSGGGCDCGCDGGDTGSIGSNGGLSRWNTTIVGNGGQGGQLSSNGANGTASGGDTNTTGAGASGGAGGSGGDGGSNCGGCEDDGEAGLNGHSGGNGGRAIKEYAAGTFSASQSISRTVGQGGGGGSGGDGGDGASVPGCSDGENGSAGSLASNGSITLAWSL